MDITELLAFSAKQGASDLHLSAGLPPMIRVDGDTLHANNANQAIERVINLFPQDLHKQLFMDLSMNLRAVVSQRLVKGMDGKRIAAIEILVNTPHIADLILKGEIHELKEAMEGSGMRGMQTFDMALHTLFKEERIELEEALGNADSRTNLEAKINFG